MELLPTSGEIVIERAVVRVISYDGKTGECIFVVKNNSAVPDPSADLKCVAVVPFLTAGTPLRLKGKYINDPERRKEPYFQVSESRLCLLGEDEMTCFFKSVEPSVRKNKYRKFIRKYGADIFSFMERTDAKDVMEAFFLNEAEDTSNEAGDKCQTYGTNIYFKMSSTISRFAVFDFLLHHGIPAASINHACAGYPALTVEKVLGAPYSFVSDFGFPFDACDAIAIQNGLDMHDDSRIAAVIKEALRRNEEDGNTCTTIHSLKMRVNYIIKQSYCKRNPDRSNPPDEEFIDAETLLYSLSFMKDIALEKEDGAALRIYREKTWRQEKCIAKHRKRLDSIKKEYTLNKEIGRQTKLSDEQDMCLDALRTSGIKILIGGPGTGKTTTIGEMVRVFHANHPEQSIALCAPTGRASQKMKEVSENPAMTAQKLINFKPYGDEEIVSEFDENRNLPYDLIIADEWSMGDTELTAILLRAVKNGAIIIFSGDVNQLNSVGCGSVLSDFVSSGVMEVYRLTKIYRQEKDNAIIKNAYKIINGEKDLIYDEHFERHTVHDTKDIVPEVLRALKHEMVQSHIDDVQILCTYKKTGVGAGTTELNDSIKTIVNPNSSETISVGDKAIMLKNNYKKGYFNGDMGIVTKTGTDYRLAICGGTLTIGRDDLCDMTLAYAITVHKSQGSEYPVVIIVLPSQFRNLRTRNLLYTAVTRAKTKVVIIDEEGVLEDTIANLPKKRLTGLVGKLQEKKIRRLGVITT